MRDWAIGQWKAVSTQSGSNFALCKRPWFVGVSLEIKISGWHAGMSGRSWSNEIKAFLRGWKDRAAAVDEVAISISELRESIRGLILSTAKWVSWAGAKAALGADWDGARANAERVLSSELPAAEAH